MTSLTSTIWRSFSSDIRTSLGVAFQKRKAQIAAPDQSKFVAEQLAWIRDRNARCQFDGKGSAAIEVLASSKSCMVSAIRERIAVLAQTDSTAAAADAASSSSIPPQSSYWWWCDAPRGYYPSVPRCSTPWRASNVAPAVAAQPTRPPTPLATIADDTGQWAGTIRVDTLKFDSARKGSATVCHQSEHGPSCNVWTFDCDRFALLDKMFAHSDYFPPFMQTPNARSTPEQNAELEAMNAVATKLPATACRLGGMAPPIENLQWIEVRENTGAVKATIDLATVKRDDNGNAHARVCLNSEPGVTCPDSKTILRWYFDCRTHEYSWLDTTFMPQLPREMKPAQPGSVADKLATLACR